MDAETRYSCSAVFSGLFNGLFPKWIQLSMLKVPSVPTYADIDKYLSHDSWLNFFFLNVDKHQSEDF